MQDQDMDRSSNSKSRSSWVGVNLNSGLTHELTDIWTPDKDINDDHDTYAMYPCNHSPPVLWQWRIWRLSKIVAVCIQYIQKAQH